MSSRLLRSPTIAEIARAAGVSTATVIRVLKSNGYVADTTREKVTAVLREVSYRPNLMASALRTQRSQTVGLILTSLEVNPFFAKVARGVEEEAIRHGYKTIIFNHNGDEEREREGVARFLERRVDALLFCTPLLASNVQAALDAGVAVAQIERETEVPSVSVAADNYVGAREAMDHLIRLGHHRIAFIGGDPKLSPYRGPDAVATVFRERYAFPPGSIIQLQPTTGSLALLDAATEKSLISG